MAVRFEVFSAEWKGKADGWSEKQQRNLRKDGKAMAGNIELCYFTLAEGGKSSEETQRLPGRGYRTH